MLINCLFMLFLMVCFSVKMLGDSLNDGHLYYPERIFRSTRIARHLQPVLLSMYPKAGVVGMDSLALE